MGNKERKQRMREKTVEKRLCMEAKRRGGIALKFVSPGFDGVPDRVVLMPGGKCAFVELKSTGEKLRPLQEKRKSQIEKLGFRVYVADRTGQIGGILDEICGA